MNAIKDFLEWLDDYLNFERNPQKDIFWLDTIDFLCKRFDNPQDYAPCIHVAGSKGKGSVSKLISCILCEAGYKTGVYSSPHITDFRERISLADKFLSDKIYEKTAKELIRTVSSIIPEELPAGRPVTWFELVTLYAFLCFKNAKVDWSVYEVGLGGRLDSTNIIRPKICCITPIELEHTEFLGDTIEKIAAEKAGIIKNCTPVVIAPQTSEAAKIVLREKAITRHAPYYFVEDIISDLSAEFDAKEKRMNVSFNSEIFNRPINAKMKLLGKMQAQNAAMAAITIKKLFPNLDEQIIENGLSKATLPGRFEILENIPDYKNIPHLILDGAHTLNSIKLTLETVEKLFPQTKINLLFACAADKDVHDIALEFCKKFKKIWLTKPGSQKQSDLKKARDAFTNASLSFECSDDYNAMIKQALEESAKEKSVLLVTGSFYLLAEVKNLINQA